MSEPKNILVATDFSPPSEAAVRMAFALAVKTEATVHVLHVFTLQDKTESEALTEHAARAAERRKLDAIADAQRGSGRLGDVLWSDGDPAVEILNAAQAKGADLLVIGASGRKGFLRLRL